MADLPGTVIQDESADLPEIRIMEIRDLLPMDMEIDPEDASAAGSILDPENENVHEDGDIARLTQSVGQHGVLEAIQLNRATGKLIGGHGRLQAMLRAGQKRAIVIVTSKDWQAHAAARIALNADYGHLDNQRLRQTLLALNESGAHDLEMLTSLKPMQLETIVPEIAGYRPTRPVDPPAAFPSFDGQTIPVDYECPSCGYAWSGKPKPTAS